MASRYRTTYFVIFSLGDTAEVLIATSGLRYWIQMPLLFEERGLFDKRPPMIYIVLYMLPETPQTYESNTFASEVPNHNDALLRNRASYCESTINRQGIPSSMGAPVCAAKPSGNN